LAQTLQEFPDSKSHLRVMELKAMAERIIREDETISLHSISSKSTAVRKAAKEMDVLNDKILGGGHVLTVIEEQRLDDENKVRLKQQLYDLSPEFGIQQVAEHQTAFLVVGSSLNGRSAKISAKKKGRGAHAGAQGQV
jgi:hypothetical protein